MNNKLYLDCVPLFESYINTALVIVDVQIPFKKWWKKNGKDTLPKDIANYSLNFNQVYQIWDNHKADGPDIFYGPSDIRHINKWSDEKFIIKNLVGNYEKHYGVDDPSGEIRDYTKIFKKEDIDEAMKLAKSDEIIDEHKKFECIDGKHYALRVIGGSHKWFFPSIELYNAMKSIQGEIVLVGGAEGECLKDIEYMFDVIESERKGDADHVLELIHSEGGDNLANVEDTLEAIKSIKVSVNRKYCYNAKYDASKNANAANQTQQSTQNTQTTQQTQQNPATQNSTQQTTQQPQITQVNQQKNQA